MQKIVLLLWLTVLGSSSYAQRPLAELYQKADLPDQPSTTTLTGVLETLEKQYQTRFSYDQELLKDKRVSRDAVSEGSDALEVVLTRLLKPLRLTFEQFDSATVIIYPEAKQKALRRVKKQSLNTREESLLPSTRRMESISSTQADLEKTITGQVTDLTTNEGLPGVNIVVKSTTIGTVTDIDGNYRLTAPDDAETLVFSSVGYLTEEIAIGNQTTVDLQMSPDVQSLSEVVVIGYGTVDKKDLTGSVASIKGEEVARVPTPRLDDALRGKVSGVQITPTSGEPGADVTIRIRGSNSLNASNEPLVVIDGFIGAGNLNNINTNDIESIEVLKDASATAIYGSRGSNGVILVTTKRGKKGESKFSLDTYTGLQDITRTLDLMSSRQYAEFQNDIAASTGASPVFPDLSAVGDGTDWQDEVFRRAPMTSSTLSISGGDEKTNFYLSGNYLNQEGIYINTDFKRYLARFNLDHTVNDFIKTGVSLSLSRSYRNGGISSLRNVLGYDPTLEVKDQNGDYVVQTRTSEFSNDNPVSLAQQTLNETRNTAIIGNVYGEWKIVEALTYRLTAGVNTDFLDRDIYSPSTLFSQRDLGGTAIVENRESFNVLLEHTLNYNKEFGDNSIGALVGYTRQTDEYKQRRAQVNGFASDEFATNNLDAGTERLETSSTLRNTGLESVLFRVNYGFQSKYLLTLTGRSDGSSVFAKNDKWAFFPSAAVAWRVIEEGFMSNSTLVSDLKVRASYGRIGNQAIDPYQSLSRISNNNNNYILGAGQNLVTGFAPTGLANDDLRWETTTSLDIGVDISFLNNRLNATLDYYRSTTDDLLISVTIPQLTGFNSALRNFGKVDNNGLELSLNSINVDNENFRWETNFNISGNRNTVVDIFNPEGFFLTNSGVRGTGGASSGIIQEGEPLGAFYGLVREGIWNDQAEIDASGLTGYAVFPGGRRYADLDGDREVEANDDRQIIGDANPKFFGGLGNNFSYRGLELSFFLQFIYGNDIFNEADYYLGQAFDYNAYASLANRWTPENTNTDIPSIEGSIRSIASVSETNALKDGSFVRLRNINLAYNLPVGNIDWLRAVKVYVTGTNLLLFDKYDGYDPEINRDGGNTGQDNLRRGYDDSGYPISKNVILGVIVDF